MIRTRRSFLQRVKERGQQEQSPLRTNKKGTVGWTQSNDDIVDRGSNDGDSLLATSTGSCDELILGPPTPARNSAQEAAEALRRDLEDMGYDLDCKSFITRGTTESDSVCVERYQRPPRKLKPKSRSSAASSSSAMSSKRREKDIIMSMRSLASPSVDGGTSMDKVTRSRSSSESRSRPETSDWTPPNDDSDVAHAASSTEGRSQEADTDDAIYDEPSAPVSEPSIHTYGSLKKIVTVQAAASFNETTISSLRKRVAQKKSSEVVIKTSVQSHDDEATKKEQHSVDSSALSKSAASAPMSIQTPPVPDTLNVPVRKHSSPQVEVPKTPILIEGMSFVKNTTLAPESARNSTLSPRTRHARVKLRRLIQEKLEKNQGTDITSAKTAPAKQTSAFFESVEKRSEKDKRPSQKVLQDTKIKDQATGSERCEKVDCNGVAVTTPIERGLNAQSHIDTDVGLGLSVVAEAQKDAISVQKSSSNVDAAEKHAPLVPAEEPMLVAEPKPAKEPKTPEEPKTVEETKPQTEKVVAIEKVLASSDATPSPKKTKQSQNVTSRRKFRPLSVFRKASISPQKKRKQVVTTPVPTKTSVIETPKEDENAVSEESGTKEGCSYVGYDIQTDDGVEVVAIAKTLPYISPGSPNGSQERPSSQNDDRKSVGGVQIQRHNEAGVQIDVSSGEASTSHQDDTGVDLNNRKADHAQPRCDEPCVKTAEEHTSWSMISSLFSKPLTSSAKGCVKANTQVNQHDTNVGLKANQTAAMNMTTEGPAPADFVQDSNAIINIKKVSTFPKPSLPVNVDLQCEKALKAEKEVQQTEIQSPMRQFPALNRNLENTATSPKKKSGETSKPHKETQPKWKPFRLGFKSLRKNVGLREKKGDDDCLQDRHEVIQDFLDNALEGQEEHSFPSKLDPNKNPQGAGLLQEMISSQIPKQLIISKLDDSSCITTDTDKKKHSWHEKPTSPSALDASIWDEIADAGVLVTRAIADLEEASKTGDASTKAGSTISREIEKALWTLKRHADRLGVTETDLLLAVKSTDGAESDRKAKIVGESSANGSSNSSASTAHTPNFSQDIFQAFQGLFTKS